MGNPAHLIACHDCDLLHHRGELPQGASARCGRCGAVLYRNGRDVLNRTLAFALASLLLFAVANVFPFMEFKISGRVQVNHLTTGAVTLAEQGYMELAALVVLTSTLAPAVMIAGLLLLVVPLRAGRRPAYLPRLTKALEKCQPWSMMEVYMLGVIVSVIKLADMADIVLGPGVWAFAALILTLTAAIAIFDPHVVWDQLEDAA